MKRTYDFGPDQVASINALATELNIDKTDVLMEGLRLFRVAVREAKRGNRIGVVNDQGPVGELIGKWSDVVSVA